MHKKQTQEIRKAFFVLEYNTLKSGIVQRLASRGWHPVNKQEQLLAGRGREGEMLELKDVSNKRWRASSNFTHAGL